MLCRGLLAAIVALGLVSAVAFSASYQLVARFANKNVVSLGLGCVGSGLLVLLLETAVRMRSSPTRAQLVILFELTAGQLQPALLSCRAHPVGHMHDSSSPMRITRGAFVHRQPALWRRPWVTMPG